MRTRDDSGELASSVYENAQITSINGRLSHLSNGLSPTEALNEFHDILSPHEKNEILQYNRIYFVGRSPEKHPLPNNPSDRRASGSNMINLVQPMAQTYKTQQFPSSTFQGSHPMGMIGPDRNKATNEISPVFDDPENFYRIIKHDHIAYRFEVLSTLGKGSFGQVVLAMDHMKGTQVALKIIRTESRFTRQAREEIRILEELRKIRDKNSKDPQGLDFPIVQMFEHFTFRKHICMTFELLSINLYDLLKLNKFTGLSRDRVRWISLQVLKALCYIGEAGIIHCDLKPENVLLIWLPDKDSASGMNGLTGSHRLSANQPHGKDLGSHFDHKHDYVKLIDFGSSCFEKGTTYPYIQSRFYRAPEVILRLGYSQPIDIWSFGCLVAELINGLPLFPGEDEADQLACIMEILGMPPNELLQCSPQLDRYFIKYKREKQKTSDIMNFVDRMSNSSVQDITYLPRYCSITYPDNGGSPELLPRNSKRNGTLRGIPGSMPLLKAILEPRHRRHRRKDPQSMANLANQSSFAKSPVEEAALLKDNELLLGFMLSCLTWSPLERIKPDRAIKNMWLRNFTKKPSSSQVQAHLNVPEQNSNARIRSMEMSQFISVKPKEYQNGHSDLLVKSNPPKEQVTSRIRKRLDNVLPESLPYRPTVNLTNSFSTGESKDNPSSEPVGDKSHSPPRFMKIISPARYLGNGPTGGLSINTISISPTKSLKCSDPVSSFVGKPFPAPSNRRVTLIYPPEQSDYENRSEGKSCPMNQSVEDASLRLVRAKPALRSRKSMPLATSAISYSFGHNATCIAPNRNVSDIDCSPEEVNQTAGNSRVIFHSSNGVRPYSEYHTKSEAQSNVPNQHALNPPIKLSGSMPYLNSTGADGLALNRSSYRQAPPYSQEYNHSNVASQLIIKKMPEQPSPSLSSPTTSNSTNHSRVYHMVHSTNGIKPNSSISNIHPQHVVNTHEPRLIHISTSRQASMMHTREDSDVEGAPSNSWDSQRSLDLFKSIPRHNQTAPEVAPKPTPRDVVLFNSTHSTGRSDSMANLSVMLPYYQTQHPSNVVYRRVNDAYHRGPTIEIQPHPRFSEY